jgi:hypothetical protein
MRGSTDGGIPEHRGHSEGGGLLIEASPLPPKVVMAITTKAVIPGHTFVPLLAPNRVARPHGESDMPGAAWSSPSNPGGITGLEAASGSASDSWPRGRSDSAGTPSTAEIPDIDVSLGTPACGRDGPRLARPKDQPVGLGQGFLAPPVCRTLGRSPRPWLLSYGVRS